MALSTHTGSTETWSSVVQWVQACSASHSCMDKVNIDWYPTRLVESMRNGKFRVIRSDSCSFQRGRGYITLSHRWGKDDFMKLTKDRLAQFQNGLPSAMLRKTFQDTLIVAQRIHGHSVRLDRLPVHCPG